MITVRLVLGQPCCGAFGADLLSCGLAVGGGGGKAVLSQISGVDGSSGVVVDFVASGLGDAMILSAIAERLKRRFKNDSFGCASYSG